MAKITIPAFILIISLLIVYRKQVTRQKVAMVRQKVAMVRQKVAILGGGAASCSAALALTDQPDWKERYDVTIDQLGWRLGGKAASGRNRDYGHRIEEITGRIFTRNYLNFKRLLRSIYEELNRPEGVPIRTFHDAFAWKSFFPFLNGSNPLDSTDDDELCLSVKYLFQKLVRKTSLMIEMMAKQMNGSFIKTDGINVDQLLDDTDLLWEQMNTIQRLISDISTTEENNSIRELLSAADTASTVIKGILDDNLLENGYDAINHLDLREWLKKHGANSKTLDSGFVKFHYDMFFSYRNGNIDEPDSEAGTLLKFALKFYFCYDDISYFHGAGGDGDVIFAPIYEVLRKRGVRFKFFHKVEELKLNINNPKLVEHIRVTKQADLINEEYDPLINVKGLPSWPNEPKYEEIVQKQANLLMKNNIDLESFWTRWPNVYEEHFKQPLPEIVLKRGRDFDIIVFGIPVGSLPYLCSELLEASPSLRNTNTYIGRTSSAQLQMWGDIAMTQSMTPCFYSSAEQDFMVSTGDPGLKLENWESLGINPKNLQYVTFVEDIDEIPPSNHTWFPHECREKVKKFVKSRVENSLENCWPGAYKDGNFQWEVLTGLEERTGEERLEAQYFRVNINPSDRYTQFLTNTSQYRIKIDGAGLDNIYFVGDWIQTGINCCVEGAVTAGLLASKAISGYPENIFLEP